MPRKRRKGMPRRGELTGPEDVELLWGAGHRGSVFESVFTKRRAAMSLSGGNVTADIVQRANGSRTASLY